MLAVLVRMSLQAETGEATPSAAVLEDMIWAAAHPIDGLEHLTVAADRTGLSLMVFVCAADNDCAEEQVGRLMFRTLQRARPLAGWSLTECSTVNL